LKTITRLEVIDIDGRAYSRTSVPVLIRVASAEALPDHDSRPPACATGANTEALVCPLVYELSVIPEVAAQSPVLVRIADRAAELLRIVVVLPVRAEALHGVGILQHEPGDLGHDPEIGEAGRNGGAARRGGRRLSCGRHARGQSEPSDQSRGRHNHCQLSARGWTSNQRCFPSQMHVFPFCACGPSNHRSGTRKTETCPTTFAIRRALLLAILAVCAHGLSRSPATLRL